MLVALIKKEVRENLVAAVVGLAASLLLLAIYMRPPDTQNYYSIIGYNPYPLPVAIATASYGIFLTTVCCGLGLLLGFLMSWKETLKKTWPLLIHRPVSKERILAAKLLGGALLYTAAVGVPFLLLSAWCALPGKYPAPWMLEYVYPGLEALARGYLLFLATVLCGLREARWYVTRFLPLVGVITLLIFAAVCRLWPIAVAIYFLSGLILLAAIWQEFIPAKRGRLPVAIPLYAGITTLILIILVIAGAITEKSEKKEGLSAAFSLTGEPLLLSSNNESNIQKLQTVDGEVVYEGSNFKINEKILPAANLNPRPNYYSQQQWKPWHRGYPIEKLPYYSESGADEFYFLHKEGLLATYSLITRQPVGYWGRNGFETNKDAAQPFSDRGNAVVRQEWKWPSATLFINSGQGFYFLDNDLLTVVKIPDEQATAADSDADYYHRERPVHLFALGRGCISVCDAKGQNAKRFILPEKAAQRDDLTAWWINDNALGISAGNRSCYGHYHQLFSNIYMCKIDNQGGVLWEKTIAAPREVLDFPPDWLVLSLEPPALGAFGIVMLTQADWKERKEDVLMWLERTGPIFYAAFIAKLLLCAAVAFFLLRRWGHSLASQIGWSFFAFLGGVSGLLVVWALLLSEKRVRCFSCGGYRPPSRTQCPRCAAPWPAPERRETDIFALNT